MKDLEGTMVKYILSVTHVMIEILCIGVCCLAVIFVSYMEP